MCVVLWSNSTYELVLNISAIFRATLAHSVATNNINLSEDHPDNINLASRWIWREGGGEPRLLGWGGQPAMKIWASHLFQMCHSWRVRGGQPMTIVLVFPLFYLWYPLPMVEFMKFCSKLPSHVRLSPPEYFMYSSVSYHALTPHNHGYFRFQPSILPLCHYQGFQSWANVSLFWQTFGMYQWRYLQKTSTLLQYGEGL